MGRKNWLFADTPGGARANAIVYTVMETAKAKGLNPEKYISYLLTVLPKRFAKAPKPLSMACCRGLKMRSVYVGSSVDY